MMDELSLAQGLVRKERSVLPVLNPQCLLNVFAVDYHNRLFFQNNFIVIKFTCYKSYLFSVYNTF